MKGYSFTELAKLVEAAMPRAGGAFSGNVSAPRFIGPLRGNADTATAAGRADKLSTARNITIGSTTKAFDGTENLSWSLAEIGAINASATVAAAHKWATPRALQIGNSSKAVDGSTNVAWSLAEIGALPLTGGTLAGGLTFSMDSELAWVRNTDYAKIGFKNTGDGDTDSYMWFKTGDNGDEYFKWQSVSGSTTTDWMSLKSSGLAVAGSVTAPTFYGTLSGNAATATKLATARSIGGVAFDGTANINLPGVNTAGNQDTTGNAATATQTAATAAAGATADLVKGAMGTNDYFRIRVGGNADAGWTEIATAGNGDEPIYVRQYNGFFGSVARELELLDASGNTILPGYLQTTRVKLKNVDGGFGEGNGNAANSSVNNVKISSWFGVGFGPSITGQPVPYGEYSHWFNTRNGDMGVRGTITATRFAGNAASADRAASALNSSFFTATNGGEGQIGATCAGYQPAYLFNNSGGWGVFSPDGGAAFTYTRGAGFNFNGHANSAAQATAVASGDWDGVDLLYGRMATDDYFRLRIYGSGYDHGAVELATADNGTEPIYVRQYDGDFVSVVNEMKLLDEGGNTVIPGYVYAANGVLRETAVLTGEIGHGGWMPIPNGFTEGQCAFFVSPRDTNSSGYNWDLREGLPAQHYRIICYPAGRVAQGYTRIYNDVNDSYEDRGFNMSYLVIGVK